MEVRTISKHIQDQVSISFPPDDPKYQPEIIWKAKGLQEELTVTATMVNWVPGDEFSQAIFRAARDEYTQKIPSDWYNGVLNTFRGMTIRSDGSIHLSLGTVMYFDYLTSGLAEFAGNEVIEKPNPIVLSSILVTSDGKMVFGNRSARTSVPRPGMEQLSQIGVIGGTYNRQVLNAENGQELIQNRSPQEDILNEVTDELGITQSEVDLTIHAILRDNVLSRTILLFFGDINLTSQELIAVFHERGNKNEHFDLVFVDIAGGTVQALLKENITIATSMALASILGDK